MIGFSGVGRDDLADGVADLPGVLQLGAGVGLRRILEPPPRVRVFGGLLDALAGAVGRDGLHRGPVGAEDHPALQDRRRVVEVHDGLRCALTGGEGALDQLRPALREHLNGDVFGDGAVDDDLADEVEVGLAGRGEPDLDLLVAHAHQQLEHAALAGRAHRVDQCLVAVAQVDRAPQGSAVDDAVGPAAVGQLDGLDFFGEGPVAVHRHGRTALRVPRGLAGRGRAGGRVDGARRGIGVGPRRLEVGHGNCSGGVRRNLRPAHRERPRREAGLDQTPSRRPRRSTRCTRATLPHRAATSSSCFTRYRSS